MPTNQVRQPRLGADAPLGKEHGYNPSARSYLAPMLAILSCLLFCCNGELLQALQTRTTEADGHASPLLNMALCHLGGIIFIPYFMCNKDARATLATANSTSTMPLWLLSLLFAGLIMGYNYCWLLSAKFISIGLTNAIFQTSVALIYIASTFLFAEPVRMPQIFGVVLALMGSILAANGASNSLLAKAGTSVGPSVGIALALLAACGFAAYQLLFRFWFCQLKNNVRFVAYFGAWVSVWHIFAIFPLIWWADFAGIEQLTFPRSSLAICGTIASAAIASVVNGLYLCIIMWGSPMLLPCTSALSVPLTVGLDFTLHGLRPSHLEALGHGLVVVSVVLIMDLHAQIAGAQNPKAALGKFDRLDDL